MNLRWNSWWVRCFTILVSLLQYFLNNVFPAHLRTNSDSDQLVLTVPDISAQLVDILRKKSSELTLEPNIPAHHQGLYNRLLTVMSCRDSLSLLVLRHTEGHEHQLLAEDVPEVEGG